MHPKWEEDFQKFVEALRQISPNITAGQIADVIYLTAQSPAPRYEPVQQSTSEEAPAKTSPTASPIVPNPVSVSSQVDQESVQAPPNKARELRPRSPRRPSLPEETDSHSIYQDLPPSKPPVPKLSYPASLLRTPVAKPLKNSLQIGRALRPLSRRILSRRHSTLDIDGTIEFAAALNLAQVKTIVPVLRPEHRRWFNLDIVIDDAATMRPWSETIKEFCMVLEHTGNFNSIQTWLLQTDISSGQPPVLRSKRTGGKKDAPAVAPHNLISTQGERIILILTDCKGQSWYDGTAFDLLAAWGNHANVALVQVLPESLWHFTSLPQLDMVTWAGSPGAVNDRLPRAKHKKDEDFLFLDDLAIADISLDAQKSNSPREIPIPVLQLKPNSLEAWSRMVAGHLGRPVPALNLRHRANGFSLKSSSSTPPKKPGTLSAPKITRQSDAEAEWLLLRAGGFSPLSRRLRSYLSLWDELTLPFIRSVRDATLPMAEEGEIAELLMSGLLKVQDRNSSNPRYIWADGVQNLLRSQLVDGEIIWVIGQTSSWIAAQASSTRNESALILDLGGTETLIINGSTLPFARATIEVLNQLSPFFKARAVALREGIDNYQNIRRNVKASPPPSPGGEAPSPIFRYDVFLSHCAQDKDVMRQLANWLKDDGVHVWFDEWEIQPGDNIAHKINDGLQASRVLVLAISKNALASDWDSLENNASLFRDPITPQRHFVPLRLDRTPLPPSLQEFSYINWIRKSKSEYAKLLSICEPSLSNRSKVSISTTPRYSKRKGKAFDRIISTYYDLNNEEIAAYEELKLLLRFLAHHDTVEGDYRFKLRTKGRAVYASSHRMYHALVEQKILGVENGWYKILNLEAILNSRIFNTFSEYDKENRTLYFELLKRGKDVSTQIQPTRLAAFLADWANFLVHESPENETVLNVASSILYEKARPNDLAIDLQEKTNTFFTIAIMLGNLELVRSWLNEGASVNWASPRGKTALYFAPWTTDIALVRLLLDHGAIVNVQDADGWTPFMGACWCGDIEIVKLLHQSKADVHASHPNLGNACTIAARQNHLDILEYLVEFCHINANISDEWGRTPLDWAIQQGHSSIVAYLLNSDTIFTEKEENFDSPLELALQPTNSDLLDEQLEIVRGIATLRPDLINTNLVNNFKRFERNADNVESLNKDSSRKAFVFLSCELLMAIATSAANVVDLQLLAELITLSVDLVVESKKMKAAVHSAAVTQVTKAINSLTQNRVFLSVLQRLTIQELGRGKQDNVKFLFKISESIAAYIFQGLRNSRVVWRQLGFDDNIWMSLIGGRVESIGITIDSTNNVVTQHSISENWQTLLTKQSLDVAKTNILLWGRDKASLRQILWASLSTLIDDGANNENLVSEVIFLFKEIIMRYSVNFFQDEMYEAGVAASLVVIKSCNESSSLGSEDIDHIIDQHLWICCPSAGNYYDSDS